MIKPVDNLTKEINFFLNRLYPLCRSITGEANRESLKILQEIIPLTIHEVPSGTKVYDWVIPDEWSIRNGWIADEKGQHIVDFKESNLHVSSYSVPVNASLSWRDLKSKIHRHEKLSDAIPYRTLYYKRDWGFCVTGAQYKKLSQSKQSLQVVIDSELKPGSLSYGEYLVKGRSTREILISCYICHPSMANDNLSGMILTALLARYIANLPKRHWSYRVIFVPETIGAITYCSLNEKAMKLIDTGLVITTIGGPGNFSYKQSWDPSHYINELIEDVLREGNQKFDVHRFDIHGSDERQYSSQAFRINTASIFKDKYYNYNFYHTSLDDLNFVRPENIRESLSLYQKLITKLEELEIFESRNRYCETMLSKHGLYPDSGGALIPKCESKTQLDMILWILFFCNGKIPIQSVAKHLKVGLSEIRPITDLLVQKNLIFEV